MVLVNGNLWSEVGKSDIIFFTANSGVNSAGELVMGKGAALEAKSYFPMAPRFFGEVLQRDDLIEKPFGILYTGEGELTQIGAFQVKFNFKEDADLGLIRMSTWMLSSIAEDYDRISLNYPGIGAGKLAESVVRPIIQSLPDNVFVYKK